MPPMSRDIRPRVIQNALSHPDLGNAERVFLLTVAMVATEYVDGQRRSGSRGMDERGRFALHYDYLARALHTSPGNAKKLAQRLEVKGFLSKVHPGTFGRPAGYQSLDVRGDTMSPVTFRSFVPPYGMPTPALRGDTTSPLPYRTPSGPGHEPTSGVSPQVRVTATSSREDKTEASQVGGQVTGCPWHDDTHPCPPDCANHPHARRRTA